ncbi:hypothetical protein [Streptomyces uncialis]|uniref:hypothetical protein n=1 Tax=Streptomyces uncialis TaxID=1048205 RepID=UPI002F90A4FB|nr:hypothetical protein OG268_37295 [Streptomyces uncialis]
MDADQAAAAGPAPGLSGRGEQEEQRVRAAVRRRGRGSAFAEAEGVIAFVLSDPGMREARARVEEAEAQLGRELCARLQPFQDRYDQAVRDGDAARLSAVCAGKHGRWGRICVLDDRHETSMEEPHWGRTSEGRPIAWVGSAPDNG